MGLQATIQAAVTTAFAAIDDLVADVWLTRQVAGAYSTATGDVTETEVEYWFEGVVDTTSQLARFNSNSTATAGSEIEGESVKVYLKPGEVEPKRGDVLRIDETRFRVVTVAPVKPNGITVLLWELGVSV